MTFLSEVRCSSSYKLKSFYKFQSSARLSIRVSKIVLHYCSHIPPAQVSGVAGCWPSECHCKLTHVWVICFSAPQGGTARLPSNSQQLSERFAMHSFVECPSDLDKKVSGIKWDLHHDSIVWQTFEHTLEQVQTYTAVEVIAHHFCNDASWNPNFKLLCRILQIAVTLPTDTLESQVFMTLMKQGPKLLQKARPLT